MTELFKWQHKDYKALSLLQTHKSQVILLSATPGLGDDVLLKNYISLLLCDSNQELSDGLKYSCKNCSSCKLFINNNHPDFYELSINIEEDKKNISVEDIRAMIGFLSTTTHISKNKIVLIPNADLLSINSANALLKILEEPPSYAMFILQTTNISGILPTIKSRCHIYKLSSVSYNDAHDYVRTLNFSNPEFWLNYYDNAPLFEVEITQAQFDVLMNVLTQPSIDNIFATSSEFEGKDMGFVLSFFIKWLNDLTCAIQGVSPKYFKDYNKQIDNLISRIDQQQLFYLFDKINFLQDWATHPLNHKLQIENLLLQYQSLFTKQ